MEYVPLSSWEMVFGIQAMVKLEMVYLVGGLEHESVGDIVWLVVWNMNRE